MNYGAEEINWQAPHIDDFIEDLHSIVIDDVYDVMVAVHRNWDEVQLLTTCWFKGQF